jgi:hypothetical protein
VSLLTIGPLWVFGVSGLIITRCIMDAVAPDRERDPLRSVPYPPHPRRPGEGEPWKNYTSDVNSHAWESISVDAIRGLAHGDLDPRRSLAPRTGSSLSRDVLGDVQRRHAELGTRDWPLQGDADSFRSVVRDRGTQYPDNAKPCTESSKLLLKKGDICPSVPEDVALPVGDIDKLDMDGVCGEVDAFLSEPASMVRKEHEVDWERAAAIRSYHDPGFGTRDAMLRFAKRRVQAKMVAFTALCVCTISLFTVVKKLVPGADGAIQIVSRLVIDYREGNTLFYTPPYLGMANPSMFGWLELGGSRSDLEFATTVGDIPDFYYRLRLPLWLVPYFILPLISARDLYDACVVDGIECPCPGPSEAFVGLVVPAMGWSWACYLAHMTLQSIVERAPLCPPRRRWMDGVPLVQPQPGEPTHWFYIDDFGAGSLEKKGSRASGTSASSTIGKVKAQCEKVIRAAGLDVHKVETAVGLPCSLGVTITGSPLVAKLPALKMKVLVLATLFAIGLQELSGLQMASLIGHWTWALMVCRPALSVLSACYAFSERQTDREPRRLWDQVVLELWTLVGLFVFFEAPLELCWATICFATDASEEGYGIVQRGISVDEARTQASLCQRRGWLRAVEQTFSHLEEEALVSHDDWEIRTLEQSTGGTGIRPSDLFPKVLFWGPHSSTWLGPVLQGRGWLLEARCWEGEPPAVADLVLSLLRGAKVSCLVLDLPEIRAGDRKMESWVAAQVLSFSEAVGRKIPTALIAPAASRVWKREEVSGCSKLKGVKVAKVEVAGLSALRIVSNTKGVDALHLSSWVDLETFAVSLSEFLSSGWGLDGKKEPLKIGPISPPKVRAPSVSAEFMRPGLWSLTLRGLWKVREHINYLEMRTAVILLRHLSRCRRFWGTRILVFLDSLVSLGVLAKGRSSSWPLLRLARQAAAPQLVLQIRFHGRHVRSALNAADGPSRQEAVGAAPETKESHRDWMKEIGEHARQLLSGGPG